MIKSKPNNQSLKSIKFVDQILHTNPQKGKKPNIISDQRMKVDYGIATKSHPYNQVCR